MPTAEQVLKAIQTVCTKDKIDLPGSLMDDVKSNNKGACVSFGGDLLAELIGEDEPPSSYKNDLDPGPETKDGSFFYYMATASNRDYNHCFCVYFWNNTAILIQVYLEKNVEVLRRLTPVNFQNSIVKLRTGNAVEAYSELFNVVIEPCTITQIYTAVILDK